MGTEDEQEPEAEEEEVEETDPNESKDNKLIRDLRKQLRAKDKELKDLRPMREVNAFLSAGLGDLSESHKTALRAVAGDDLTKDNLLAKAQLLGFTATDTNGDGESKEIAEEVETINRGERVVSRPTAKPNARSLTQMIKQAKSPEEVMALVAEHGEAEGLLIEEY